MYLYITIMKVYKCYSTGLIILNYKFGNELWGETTTRASWSPSRLQAHSRLAFKSSPWILSIMTKRCTQTSSRRASVAL